ncbi:hypothetical protein [Bacillus taeanensis]|uniref:DUF4350 domain-containing protein n=1 Tax=Bacillus taeanensis TaxID=273032 RepID=A0A366XMV4_9BACI|nr:hypothetical protein [Bacillus taeanensis]RBW67680.1 hypothetical protein DS031_20625 [Bacillus taeanensis]
MKKYIIQLFVISVLLFSLLPGWGQTAAADTKNRLDIKIEAGLKGKAQYQRGFPVQLTITNNGEDFAGDLAVTIPKSYGSVGNMIIPIDIASGTTKTISFSIPSIERDFLQSQSNNQNVEMFHLYEGSWKDGKEVTIDSKLDLLPNYLPEDRLVLGVLSTNPDSLNYLKLSSHLGNSPELIQLDQEDLPKQSTGFEVLDVLVVHDYSIASLDQDVQQALMKWIEEGGRLVVGDTPNLSSKLGELANYLPVNVTETKPLTSFTTLEQLGQEPFGGAALEAAFGELQEGAEVLFSENDLPLISSLPVGEGAVTQIGYDLGSSKIIDWKGNKALWNTLFASIITAGAQDPKAQHMYEDFSQQLSDITSMFQSLANIPLSVLVLLFVLYIVVVGILLYFVLKRFDKREWSWIIIPVIAILSSVSLYMVGAKDRIGQIQTSTSAVVSLNGSGQGSGHGGVSMLSNDAGTYTMTIDSNLHPFPTGARHHFAPGSEAFYDSVPIIEVKEQQTVTSFRDVEFWTPRSLGFTLPFEEYGAFESSLVFDGASISGTITNNTRYSFDELIVLNGPSHFKIDALEAGDSKEVSIKTSKTNLFQPLNEQTIFSLYGYNGGPFLGNREEEAKRRLLEMSFWSGLLSNNNSEGQAGLFVIGFTKDHLVDVSVNSKETKESNLHLFAQALSFELPADQSISLNVALSHPDVNVITGQLHFNGVLRGEGFIDGTAGTYEFNYEVPSVLQKRGFEVKTFKLSNQSSHGNIASYQIFNRKTSAFEPIEISFGNNITKEQIDALIAENRQIRLRAVTTTNNGPIAVPAVTIEGVTKP